MKPEFQTRAAVVAICLSLFLGLYVLQPQPAQGSKTYAYEVYCFTTRQVEITRQNQDRAALFACTYDQEACQRIANRPWKGVKPNPPFECAPGKLTLEMPY